MRARTVTSDGMANVRPAAAVRARPASAAQSAFLLFTYAISPSLLESANRWLVQHERQVAASQLERRCNSGFSCKAEAESNLKKLAVHFISEMDLPIVHKYLESCKKKDDVCDAVLQLLAYGRSVSQDINA